MTSKKELKERIEFLKERLRTETLSKEIKNMIKKHLRKYEDALQK